MDYNKTEDAIFNSAMEIFKEGAVSFFGIEDKIVSAANSKQLRKAQLQVPLGCKICNLQILHPRGIYEGAR